MKGRRTIWGGRKPVRAALYMATLVATRHNSIIRASTNACVPAAKPRSSPSPPACVAPGHPQRHARQWHIMADSAASLTDQDSR